MTLKGLADRAGSRIARRSTIKAKRIRAIRDNYLRTERRKVLEELKKLPLDTLRRLLATTKK
jgi:hypothetical protein